MNRTPCELPTAANEGATACRCGRMECKPLVGETWTRNPYSPQAPKSYSPAVIVMHYNRRKSHQLVEIHPVAPSDGTPLAMVPVNNLKAFAQRLLQVHCPSALAKVCYVQQDRVRPDVPLPCIRIVFSCLSDAETFLQSTAGGVSLSEFDASMSYATVVPDRRLSRSPLMQHDTDKAYVG